MTAQPSLATTRAYVVESAGAPFVLRDVVLTDLQPSEVLVEMKYTGLCHTDIVVQQGGMPVGHFPAVFGHEGMGVVRQVGSEVKDKSLREGDAVILAFHSCGQCKACLEGRLGACVQSTKGNFTATARADKSSPIALPDGTPVFGQFFGQSSLSKMAVVTERSIVKISAAESDLQYLVPLSCGYLTGAGTVMNEFRPDPNDKIAIIGMGPVGFAGLLAAKAAGVQNLIAVDIVDSKLALAAELAASHTINTKVTGSLSKGILDIFPDGVDYIMDTSGLASLMQDSFKALAHGGTLALVGVPPPTATLEVNALELLTSCKRIVGVIEGAADPQKIVPQLVQLFHEGKFPVRKLTKCYPADRLHDALDDLKTGSAVKIVLSWEGI